MPGPAVYGGRALAGRPRAGHVRPLQRRNTLKAIDGLITNFHLPESTLIMLIAAFYGYDKTMAAYKVAVEEKYRFFSFGDAMFIR